MYVRLTTLCVRLPQVIKLAAFVITTHNLKAKYLKKLYADDSLSRGMQVSWAGSGWDWMRAVGWDQMETGWRLNETQRDPTRPNET